MLEDAIYKTGHTTIQTTVSNGRCHFTGYNRNLEQDLTVDEYLKILGPEFVCIPFEDALTQARAATKAKYVGPWDEIDEDTWMHALEALPPAGWRTVDGVELFFMSELISSNIASFYAAYNGRFFAAYRETSADYKELAAEVQAL